MKPKQKKPGPPQADVITVSAWPNRKNGRLVVNMRDHSAVGTKWRIIERTGDRVVLERA